MLLLNFSQRKPFKTLKKILRYQIRLQRRANTNFKTCTHTLALTIGFRQRVLSKELLGTGID